jgi:hypothetical protein
MDIDDIKQVTKMHCEKPGNCMMVTNVLIYSSGSTYGSWKGIAHASGYCAPKRVRLRIEDFLSC